MLTELKNITVFILAGQVLLHLLPDGGFEKYVRILFRIMILAQIVVFVFSVGRDNMQEIFEQSIAEYTDQMEQYSCQMAELEHLLLQEQGMNAGEQEGIRSD